MRNHLGPYLLSVLLANTVPGPSSFAEAPEDPAVENDTLGVATDLVPPTQDRTMRPRTRIGSRAPAAVNYVISRGEGMQPPAAKEYEIRLGALLGFSNMGATERDPMLTNVTLEATADVRFLKYLGVELDIHGDPLTAKYNSGAAGSASAPMSKQVRGFLGNVKAQYPFWWKNMRVIPKAGAGYGSISESYTNPPGTPAGGTAAGTATGVEAVRGTTVQGMFAVLGFDIEVNRRLIFFADYARSLGAGGDRDGTPLSTINYDRFRLGGFYRMGPNWGLGGQFVRRSATFDSPTPAVGTTTTTTPTLGTVDPGEDITQNQFMGMAMFEF